MDKHRGKASSDTVDMVDKTDQCILNMLAKNSRMPYVQIAKELSLSEGAIRKRVAHMKKERIIRKFTLEYPKKQTAFFIIEAHTDIGSELAQYCVVYEVTGKYQYVCITSSSKKENLTALVDTLNRIAGVNHIEILPVSRIY